MFSYDFDYDKILKKSDFFKEEIMKTKLFTKIMGILIAFALVFTGIPFTANAETLMAPNNMGWDASRPGRIIIGILNEEGIVKATDPEHNYIKYEYEIYKKNSAGKWAYVCSSESLEHQKDVQEILASYDCGDGTYCFKMKAKEYDKDTNKYTGNASLWNVSSEDFEYSTTLGTEIESVDFELDYEEICDRDFVYIPMYDEKGYDISVYSEPYGEENSDLKPNKKYPYLLLVDVMLPYGEKYVSIDYENEVEVEATINGDSAEMFYVDDSLNFSLVYQFPKPETKPYIEIGNDGESVDLLNQLGKTISVGKGTAKLSKNKNGEYVLELNNAQISGAAKSFEVENPNKENTYESKERSFGIRSNRDLNIVLVGENRIASSEDGLFYDIIMDDDSSLTISGDGTLDIYAGTNSDDGYGNKGLGYGIVTGKAFCDMTIKGGKVNIYGLYNSKAVSLSSYIQSGGELNVFGSKGNEAFSTNLYGSFNMLGGKAYIESSYDALESAALNLNRANLVMKGGELTINAEKAAYAVNGYADTYYIADSSYVQYSGGKLYCIGKETALNIGGVSGASDEQVSHSEALDEDMKPKADSNWCYKLDDYKKFKIEGKDTPVISDKIELSKENVEFKENDGMQLSEYFGNLQLLSDKYILTNEFLLRNDLKENYYSYDLYYEWVEIYKMQFKTFENYKKYSYGVILSVPEGYMFSEDLPEIYFNGKKVDEVRYELSPDCTSLKIYDLYSDWVGSEPTPSPISTLVPTPSVTPKPDETANPDVTGTPIPSEVYGLLGDVNDDGIINASDALVVLKHSAKLNLLEGDLLSRADVTADGNIDAKDALDILKYAVHLISEF